METGNLKKVASLREMILAVILTLGLVYIFSQNLYPVQKQKAIALENSIASIKKQKVELEKTKAALLLRRQINNKKIKIKTEKIASSTRAKILEGNQDTLFDNALEFLKHISDPSFTQGVNIEKIVNKKPKDEGNFVKSTLELTTLGGFKEQLRFIKKIEDTEALISIDEVEMTPQKDSTNQIELYLLTSVYQVEGVNVIEKNEY